MQKKQVLEPRRHEARAVVQGADWGEVDRAGVGQRVSVRRGLSQPTACLRRPLAERPAGGGTGPVGRGPDDGLSPGPASGSSTARE